MKVLLLSLFFVFSALSFAEDNCVDIYENDISSEPEVFLELISQSSSCYDASQLAQACARGSSFDVQTTGAAYDVCKKEFDGNRPSKDLTSFLKSMKAACDKKYQSLSGTMYISMNAYCHLSAIEWIIGLSAEE